MLGITQISKEVNKKSKIDSEDATKKVLNAFLEVAKQKLNQGESISFKGYFTVKRSAAQPKGSKHCNKHEKSLTDFKQANKGKGVLFYAKSDKFKSLVLDTRKCKDCQKKKQDLLKSAKPTNRISFKPSYFIKINNITMKKELNQKQYGFPDEAEIEKVTKRFADPNYRRVNQENNLSEPELAKKLGIDQAKPNLTMTTKKPPQEPINTTIYKCNIIIFGIKKTVLKISPHYQKRNEEFYQSKKKRIKENLNQYLLDDNIIKDFVQQLNNEKPEAEDGDKIKKNLDKKLVADKNIKQTKNQQKNTLKVKANNSNAKVLSVEATITKKKFIGQVNYLPQMRQAVKVFYRAINQVKSYFLADAYYKNQEQAINSLDEGNIVNIRLKNGGVGKSTLARAVATETTKQKVKTLLADCDPQQATSYDEYDLIIIDAPARTSQGTLEIAKRADLLIQPVGASNDDLMPAVKEFNALKEAGINKKKLLFALIRLSTPKEAEAIKEYLKDTDYSFTTNYLSEKTSYKQIQNEGKSIGEVNYKSLQKQVKQLVNEILNFLKGLGKAPQEASVNLQAPELAPNDKRISGRTKQLGLSVKPEFVKRLKILAAEEDCFIVEVLEKALELRIQQKIKTIPNKQGEYKRKGHYGLFLLGYQAGLRVSEAVNFDLNAKTQQGLYRIDKPKGKKERYVYVPPEKVKGELNLPPNVELTPHTLRRAFATYHAEREAKNLVKVDLEELPELLADNLPPFSPPNYLGKIHQLESQLTQISNENNSLKSELAREKEQNNDLQHDLNYLNKQNANLCQAKEQIKQELSAAKETISQLTQDLAQEREKRTIAENSLLIERETNANLSQKIQAYEQNYFHLQNAYQIALKDKQTAELLAEKEKQRADNYETQLKAIAKSLYQLSKVNYYQQLEKERSEQQAQIIQPTFKPPP
ncbi:3978_t:CDS:10 [Funneliformis geosporum]|uniref:3978_t:CDS:1 n=1 Tax=Funneliformis geosporum TaxID=1117311 RepID=A0A9W4SQ71_9GLOM|nr:3978_t:CDS:10 [Funneliformis geosporum]